MLVLSQTMASPHPVTSSTNSTINALVSQITADVREVWSTANNFYVRSAGVPSYNVGPFNDGNPAYPSDRNGQLRVRRTQRFSKRDSITHLFDHRAQDTFPICPIPALAQFVLGHRPPQAPTKINQAAYPIDDRLVRHESLLCERGKGKPSNANPKSGENCPKLTPPV